MSPCTVPYSMPMISRLPPDLACIAIFSSASAEMRTLRQRRACAQRAAQAHAEASGGSRKRLQCLSACMRTHAWMRSRLHPDGRASGPKSFST